MTGLVLARVAGPGCWPGLLARVADPVTAQQVIGMITGMRI